MSTKGRRKIVRKRPRASVFSLWHYVSIGLILGLFLITLIMRSQNQETERASLSQIWQASPPITMTFTPPVHGLGRQTEEDPTVQDSGPLRSAFEKARAYSQGGRMKFWSEYLATQEWKVGLPELTRLGSKLVSDYQDTDPLIPKSFNCTTFVETVSALAMSGSTPEFFGNLLKIRYLSGKATFEHRNHFPEADWIPNNVQSGILHDITESLASVGNFPKQVLVKKYDRQSWLLKNSRSLASVSSASTPTAASEVAVPYIPISLVSRIQDRIPEGAIVNFVHNSPKKFPVAIVHQGFIFRDGPRVLLRHVSTDGRIRTIPLKHYLDEQASLSSTKVGSLLGVNLNQIVK